MTQTMVSAKGADYVTAWPANIARMTGTSESYVLDTVRKLHGDAAVGDLTPEQAKAVVAEVRFWSLRDREAYDSAETAAADYERRMSE